MGVFTRRIWHLDLFSQSNATKWEVVWMLSSTQRRCRAQDLLKTVVNTWCIPKFSQWEYFWSPIFPPGFGACRVLWARCRSDAPPLCKINLSESETFGWRFSRRESLARGSSSQIILMSRRQGRDDCPANDLIWKPQVMACVLIYNQHDICVSDSAMENLSERNFWWMQGARPPQTPS